MQVTWELRLDQNARGVISSHLYPKMVYCSGADDQFTDSHSFFCVCNMMSSILNRYES